MTPGQFARHKRATSGKTITECAVGMGVTPDAYLRKERDERGWTLPNWFDLAETHGQTWAEFTREYEANQCTE